MLTERRTLWRSVGVAFLAVASLALSECRNENPTSPSGPSSGVITVTYQRAPGAVCLAGVQGGPCSPMAPLTLRMPGWPSGYEPFIIGMTQLADGTFMLQVSAPSSASAGRLRMAVNDPWFCPPAPATSCSNEAAGVLFSQTGSGISVNGVRLNDGALETSFLFYPPSEVRP